MTEKEKMLAGEIYDSFDEELSLLRKKAHKISREYNDTDETDEKRQSLLDELIPNHGKNLYLQGPVQFDYGVFTEIGDNFYANFNFVVLDCAPVKIGDNVFFGPNVSLFTATHPLCWQERNTIIKDDGSFKAQESAKPITIGSSCWLGGNVTVLPGVTIGEGSVIGAGSVVTKDIPANVVAAGNPCRVLRQITDKDKILDKN